MDFNLQSRRSPLNIQHILTWKSHLYAGVGHGISVHSYGHSRITVYRKAGGLKRFICGVPVPSHISTLILDHNFALHGDKGIWSLTYRFFLWYLFWWLTLKFISLKDHRFWLMQLYYWLELPSFLTEYCSGENAKDKAAVSMLQRWYCSGTSFCFIFGCSLD